MQSAGYWIEFDAAGGGFRIRLLQVVTAAHNLAGAGAQAHAEMVDYRVFGRHATALLIACRLQDGEGSLVVGKYQGMFIGSVLVMPMNTVLETEALQKIEICFSELHTVFARYRRLRGNVEAQLIAEDSILLAHLDDDLRHRHVLVYPLVMPMLQLIKTWTQRQEITGHALAAVAHFDVIDKAMNAFTPQTKLQKSGVIEQAFQVDVPVVRNQFDANRK